MTTDTPLTAERIAELRTIKAAYDAAIARIKAIEPTLIDKRFPDIKACVCSDEDVQAMDVFNRAIRDDADALLAATEENATLRAEVEMFEAMKEGASQRIASLEAERIAAQALADEGAADATEIRRLAAEVVDPDAVYGDKHAAHPGPVTAVKLLVAKVRALEAERGVSVIESSP